MKVCACFRIKVSSFLEMIGCKRLNRRLRKSLGVIAPRSHFNLLSTKISQPCKQLPKIGRNKGNVDGKNERDAQIR